MVYKEHTHTHLLTCFPIYLHTFMLTYLLTYFGNSFIFQLPIAEMILNFLCYKF